MKLKIAEMKRKRIKGALSARSTAKSTPRASSRSRTSSPRRKSPKSKSPKRSSIKKSKKGVSREMTAREVLNSGSVIFRSPSVKISSLKKKKS